MVISDLFIFDLTYFREVEQEYRNIFVHILVQMKTSKSSSEIKWPLIVILEKCKQQKNPEQNTEQTNPINVTALKPSKHRKSFISTVLGIHYELLGHKNERQK